MTEQTMGLTRRLEILEELIARQRKDTLKRARVMLQFNTYDRILEAYNDMIFLRMNDEETDLLGRMGVQHVRQLLNPPPNLAESDLESVDSALRELSNEQRRAATALFPLRDQVKSRCNFAMQWSIPTVDEGIRYIEQSPLDLDDKATLIETVRSGLQTFNGDDLFLPSSIGETEVEALEREIERREIQIAGMKYQTLVNSGGPTIRGGQRKPWSQ